MVSHAIAPTTYGGRESKFGFVAVFRTENELGIVDTFLLTAKAILLMDITFSSLSKLQMTIIKTTCLHSLSLISLFRYLTE